MSINDKIEAAWEEQIPNARKWLQCSRESQLLRAAGFGFEAGYLAALRSLYRELTVDEMRLLRVEDDGEIENVWFLHDGVWEPAFRLSHDSFFMWKPEETGSGLKWRKEFFLSESICRIVEMLTVPSPSDIFGIKSN